MYKYILYLLLNNLNYICYTVTVGVSSRASPRFSSHSKFSLNICFIISGVFDDDPAPLAGDMLTIIVLLLLWSHDALHHCPFVA